MINFFLDLIVYISFKSKEKLFHCGYFCENQYGYQYLKYFLKRKIKKKNVVVISFENINIDETKNVFIFKTNFFRQLIFLTLRLKYLYCTTPDLNYTIFRKSKFYRSKYIYIQHSPVSLTMIYNNTAFLEFDAVQVINQSQHKEIKLINKINNRKIKAIKSKYRFLEESIKSKINSSADLLIAPTWNTDFYKHDLVNKIKDFCKKNHISFVLKPHPMSYKKKEIDHLFLVKNNIPLYLEKELNLKSFKYLITDWSGIFLEYAIITKTKPILINTKKKVINKTDIILKAQPFEIYARDKIAYQIEIDSIKDLTNIIARKKHNLSEERKEIENFINEQFY